MQSRGRQKDPAESTVASVVGSKAWLRTERGQALCAPSPPDHHHLPFSDQRPTSSHALPPVPRKLPSTALPRKGLDLAQPSTVPLVASRHRHCPRPTTRAKPNRHERRFCHVPTNTSLLRKGCILDWRSDATFARMARLVIKSLRFLPRPSTTRQDSSFYSHDWTLHRVTILEELRACRAVPN